MKHSLWRQSGMFSFAFTAVWVAGCSTSPMSRIDANRSVYESWPVEVQSAVLEGRVEKGMTPEMVRVALGEPTRVEPRSGYDPGEEVWIYVKKGDSKMPLPNIGVGTNIGGVGVSTSTGRRGGGRSRGGSGTPEETQVVFQKGVVTRVN